MKAKHYGGTYRRQGTMEMGILTYAWCIFLSVYSTVYTSIPLHQYQTNILKYIVGYYPK